MRCDVVSIFVAVMVKYNLGPLVGEKPNLWIHCDCSRCTVGEFRGLATAGEQRGLAMKGA